MWCFLRGRDGDKRASWMTQVVAMVHLAFRVAGLIILSSPSHRSCHTVLTGGRLNEWLLRLVLHT